MFKSQILDIFLIGRDTILMICCVLIGCHISMNVQSERNKMAETNRVYCKDEFSIAEALTNFKFNSLVVSNNNIGLYTK